MQPALNLLFSEYTYINNLELLFFFPVRIKGATTFRNTAEDE